MPTLSPADRALDRALLWWEAHGEALEALWSDEELQDEARSAGLPVDEDPERWTQLLRDAIDNVVAGYRRG